MSIAPKSGRGSRSHNVPSDSRRNARTPRGGSRGPTTEPRVSDSRRSTASHGAKGRSGGQSQRSTASTKARDGRQAAGRRSTSNSAVRAPGARSVTRIDASIASHDALMRLWLNVRMAFTGEVPHEYRKNRITSEQAKIKLRSGLTRVLLVLLIPLAVALARVVLLQTIQRDGYYAASVDQRTRVDIVRASRGVIFDRHGNELAMSVPSTTIYADPRDIVDPVGTAHALAPLLGMTPEKEAALAADLAKPGSKFRYIARELPADRANAMLALGLAGVYSYTEPSRQIEGGVAQSVIGRTDPDGVGTSGLEMKYDTLLRGIDGKAVREVDKKGRSISGLGSTTSTPVPGDDLVLTIDKNIQFMTDTALMDRVGQLSAKGGTAIVMDTVTGEIYAMSNVRRDENGSAVLASGNFAAVEAYEPGSVAKVFSISAALNEGTVTPDSTYVVPGFEKIDNFLIRDAWPHGPLTMSVRDIVVKSSNIGTMLVGQTMTSSKFHDYLKAFGFGQKTGLDYPGESRGVLHDVKKWYGTQKFTVSYGYGLATTPLQLVAGVNTVANNGRYVAPRLVTATIDRDGKRRDLAPSPSRQVLTAQTAATMTDVLRGVVCKGTGTLAKVKGMEIAGKTGTGYKAQSNGTYATDKGGRKYFASFVGYFPAKAPRVTILVSIDEPDSSTRDRFGGTAAAPVFARLVPTVMHELGIAATGPGTGCKAGDTSSGH